MGNDDQAIVVGINLYPGLGNLSGAENDARSFYDWLISPLGGGVPTDNVSLITTSKFHPPDPLGPTDAKPEIGALQRAFDRLLDISEKNDDAGKGLRIGRRLYLYFAGHGIELNHYDTAQNVLLAANATRQRIGYHFHATGYLNHFLRKGCFEEAVLFMDCCREPDLRQCPLNSVPYDTGRQASSKPTNQLIGYATKSGRLARERLIGGATRGVFTTALLAGLGGAAAEGNGDITATSLSNWLYLHMKDFLTPEEQNVPGIAQQPEMKYEKDPNNRFVLVRVQPQNDWEIEFATSQVGRHELTVLNNNRERVIVLQLSPDAPARVKLPRGWYLARLSPAGTEKIFDVPTVTPNREGEVSCVQL